MEWLIRCVIDIWSMISQINPTGNNIHTKGNKFWHTTKTMYIVLWLKSKIWILYNKYKLNAECLLQWSYLDQDKKTCQFDYQSQYILFPCFDSFCVVYASFMQHFIAKVMFQRTIRQANITSQVRCNIWLETYHSISEA